MYMKGNTSRLVPCRHCKPILTLNIRAGLLQTLSPLYGLGFT